mgnify:CR=1 FL=1
MFAKIQKNFMLLVFFVFKNLFFVNKRFISLEFASYLCEE